MSTFTVPARFNGPPSSGNGGYSCGLVAKALEGPAAVSLRRPVPLDRPLEVRPEGDDKATAFADGELIAEAVPAAPLSAWDGSLPSLAEAHAARDLYDAPFTGEFAGCFVCGRSRPDGLRVYTGPVDGRDLVASPWTPAVWTAGEDGAVSPEFVWAALDCPAYFALHGNSKQVSYLARQQVEILAPIHPDVEYVVAGKRLESSGRKGLAATAIFDATGTVLAHGECLFVVPLR
ncbi:MAG: hypothetical protein BGO11_05160 [Solirubrobacterales bacterium 70-9]|nr:MAG: hypothetical protein BGO11_05160 [Solirubrobacterales bacterium 70-9]